jgi:hypothetical protein
MDVAQCPTGAIDDVLKLVEKWRISILARDGTLS